MGTSGTSTHGRLVFKNLYTATDREHHNTHTLQQRLCVHVHTYIPSGESSDSHEIERAVPVEGFSTACQLLSYHTLPHLLLHLQLSLKLAPQGGRERGKSWKAMS